MRSMALFQAISHTDITIAALLTKFKPEGAEKFVIRPYTPTSDEGKHLHISDFT